MHHEQALEMLRRQGHRITPQRVLLLSVVAENGGHVSVDEVFRQAKEAHNYMDLATVYRTLRLFRDAGIVTEVEIGDRLHYELTLPWELHHHMVCRDCKGAYNLSPHYLEGFRETLVREFGFVPDIEHFSITGVCSGCQEREGEADAQSLS